MRHYDEGQSKRTKACAFLIAIVAATVALFLSMRWTVGGALADSSAQVPDVPPIPKVIAGKPYSVTPGESPGTWVVKWGDQS